MTGIEIAGHMILNHSLVLPRRAIKHQYRPNKCDNVNKSALIGNTIFFHLYSVSTSAILFVAPGTSNALPHHAYKDKGASGSNKCDNVKTIT